MLLNRNYPDEYNGETPSKPVKGLRYYYDEIVALLLTIENFLFIWGPEDVLCPSAPVPAIDI